MTGINRQWLLAKRPTGAVTRDCFEYREVPRAPRPSDTAILIRNELLLCAPTIRNWISGNRDSYYPVIELGDPVMAPALSRIIESNDPEWPVGTRISGAGSWQDEQWVEPAGRYHRIAEDIGSVDAMGILGMNALTAYCGLHFVGQPKAGETLLVSGAAGSVGSVAAQIGRIRGCRVIALCGGDDKREWLSQAAGIADVIDYKQEDVAARLDELAPKGIDIYFDNVGGPLLRDVVARMRRSGRVVLCGQIATYDLASDTATPPLDMMRIIYGHIRLEGFVLYDYADRLGEAMADLRQWDAEGLLAHREDVRDGFDRIPDTFATLFSGGNQGTLLARIADGDGNPL